MIARVADGLPLAASIQEDDEVIKHNTNWRLFSLSLETNWNGSAEICHWNKYSSLENRSGGGFFKPVECRGFVDGLF